jgi:pyrrolysyl-tRNA synthetase-like protein
MSSSKSLNKYYRKQVDLFRMVKKMNLWPSRTGILHGVKSVVEKGDFAEIITHCNRIFTVKNSRNSRAARWLRNKWYRAPCPGCRIPKWKLEKYSHTYFHRRKGVQIKT